MYVPAVESTCVDLEAAGRWTAVAEVPDELDDLVCPAPASRLGVEERRVSPTIGVVGENTQSPVGAGDAATETICGRRGASGPDRW